MNPSQIYISIAIVVLAIIAVLVLRLRKNKSQEKLSTLSWLAFAFIFAGIIFSETQAVGYGLITTGGVLALIDIIKKIKK